VESRQGRWIRATLEGWIWSPSLSDTDRDGFDLIVSNPGGENLREAPQAEARRVARLLRGMLLDRVERQGNWTRIRRSAWVWSESTVQVEGGAPAVTAAPVAGSADSAPQDEAPPRPAELPDRILVSGEGVQLHVSPSGDTLASLRPEADLEVLARQGSWARVRVEGWVWVPSTLPADSALASAELTPADVMANPDQYRGRQVRWRLQFVSVERAEPARADFYEGEPFILARAADGEQGFVYVAVPPELLVEAEGLRPLQMIEVVGRVRTGRSALMGVPVLDLIALN
ncbi:MAG: SH3 domain-containing protein, partial [Gemmatimonadota bacterium]